MELTPKHRKNLKKLAKFLIENHKALKFNMRVYMTSTNPEPRHIEINDLRQGLEHMTECGTVGCAIGYGPAVVKPTKEDLFPFNGELCYSNYADSKFVNGDSDLFRDLFGYGWADIDNTAIGAAFRIETFLDGGPLFNLSELRAKAGDSLTRNYLMLRNHWMADKGLMEKNHE